MKPRASMQTVVHTYMPLREISKRQDRALNGNVLFAPDEVHKAMHDNMRALNSEHPANIHAVILLCLRLLRHLEIVA
jgi:hypothetical protein